MDRSLFVAMSGAQRAMQAQAQISHNLANASTVGFKGVLATTESAPVAGSGLATRINAQTGAPAFDARAGAIRQTGRDLDIALTGDHWLAVQAPDGDEAYTRAGDLQLNALGQLSTAAGHPVLGDGGPIAVPPHSKLSIGADGSVSVVPAGQGAETQVVVGRLRAVEAPAEQLERRTDGLFGAIDGAAPEAAAGNVLISGALESSNVGLADTLVAMIQNQRQFEMHVKAMRTAEENAEHAVSLLRMGG